jgi:8-oxo-dGTP diphosphatase
MSAVFIAKISQDNEKIEALAHDDAEAIDWMNLEDVDNTSFAFDHKKIISDYKKWQQSGETFWSSKK